MNARTRDNSRRQPPQEKAAPPGTDTRRAALSLLDAVLRKGLPIDSALDTATRSLERSEDRALALAIASEVLRRLPDLDALIDSATQRPLPHDAKARSVLRIALVQALILGTPAHAAIATALPLVDSGPRRLVHGVFGALTRGEASLPEQPALPDAVAMRWQMAWGDEVLEAASALVAAPPPLDLAFPVDRPVPVEGRSLLPGHVRLPRGTPVADLPGYAEGSWWVQDVAASLPARLLGAGEGRHVLDLCAAPGGKTMQLAAAGWRVTAVDVSETRLGRMAENLTRTGLAAETIAADLFKWSPPAQADAILLDAPCSATGTFRRHPDVLHRVRSHAIAELAETQRRLLDRVSGWLKPGGDLVYAVCSLEPEEGEEVIGRFLADRTDFEIVPADISGVPTGSGGWLRVLPGLFRDEGGADGFFIAHLRKTR